MGLNLYRLGWRQLMGKSGGERIGKTRANAQHRIGTLDRLFNLFGACRPAIGAVKAALAFIKNALTHQHGGVGHWHRFDPLLNGVSQAVAQHQEIR